MQNGFRQFIYLFKKFDVYVFNYPSIILSSFHLPHIPISIGQNIVKHLTSNTVRFP